MYTPVLGLEVHAELQTRTKMFCGCGVVDATQAAPNTAVCPVCAGLPGTLPVLNARAVELAVQAALALHCELAPVSVFARKNYFYPDLPKGYQISQYELPLAVNGWIEINGRRIRIRRVHLEEDTGKLTHHAAHDGLPEHSLVDLNRAGVPLLEIVTEPDLDSPEAARACAMELRAILRAIGANTGDMEKGVIRFEANVSVRPAGSSELRTRTEIKNLNSFRALERASAYEIERQARVWESGAQVQQQTMGWDEAAGVTVAQRGKEHAHDYRYFPEPDLPPLALDALQVERLRAALPELPAARRARFATQYALPQTTADLLAEDAAVADYFEQAVAAQNPKPVVRVVPEPSQIPNPKSIANWVTGELFRLLNAGNQGLAELKVKPEDLAALDAMTTAGEINLNTAKSVLEAMFQTGQPPAAIVAERGLGQVSEAGQIAAEVEAVLAENPNELAAYRAGKTTLAQWFFGQVMRRLKGRGNPQVIRQALEERLGR